MGHCCHVKAIEPINDKTTLVQVINNLVSLGNNKPLYKPVSTQIYDVTMPRYVN